MASLDSNIANVALPAIATDVHASADASIWVVNAYQLAVTVTLLTFAALGDIFGYVRIYQGALALFTVASLLCALAHSLPTLIAARIVQGVAASAQMAVTPAITRTLYPRSQLGRAVANGAVAVAAAAAAGPTVAGAILAVAPWPWIFLINIPTGLIALALGARYLEPRDGTRAPFDVPSAIEGALTFGLLVIALNGFGHGESRVASACALAGTIAIGYVFFRRQRRLELPLLPVDLFRNPVFSLSVAASVASFTALGATLVALPFLFEDVLRISPVDTGLLMTPWPLTTLLIAKLAGRLADRYDAGMIATLGMAGLSLGIVSLALLPAHPAPFDVVWRMVVCGIGTAFFQSPNNRVMLGSAPPSRSGGAGGVQALARTTGQTAGAAVVALVFGLLARGALADRAGVTTALAVAVGFTILAGALTCVRLAQPGARRRQARA